MRKSSLYERRFIEGKKGFNIVFFLQLNYGLGLGLDPRIEAMKIPYQNYPFNASATDNELVFTGFGRITPLDKYDFNVRDYVPAASPSNLQYSSAHVLPPFLCPVLGNSQLKMCAQLSNPSATICPVSIYEMKSNTRPYLISKKNYKVK